MAISNPPVYALIAAKCKGDPHIPASAAIAVALQESGGVPVFSPNDELYKENMAAAVACTSLPEALLLDALLIGFGQFKGQIAKFRLEPAYWEWSKTQKLPSPTGRFLASCSFGIGQQMMRWVLPRETKNWPAYIENFKGNLDTQADCLIMQFRTLLINYNGNIERAYKAYNSGNPNCKDPVVVARALHVKQLQIIVEQRLKG